MHHPRLQVDLLQWSTDLFQWPSLCILNYLGVGGYFRRDMQMSKRMAYFITKNLICLQDKKNIKIFRKKCVAVFRLDKIQYVADVVGVMMAALIWSESNKRSHLHLLRPGQRKTALAGRPF